MDAKVLVAEIIELGKIVQDDDTVPAVEARKRFERYVELVESLQGNEGEEVLRGLIKSIQVVDDYGAYQSTTNVAMFKFPMTLFISVIIKELPRLILDLPDWAGDILTGIANQADTDNQSFIKEFNRQIIAAPRTTSSRIMNFIEEQETEGWLEHIPGVLGGKNA